MSFKFIWRVTVGWIQNKPDWSFHKLSYEVVEPTLFEELVIFNTHKELDKLAKIINVGLSKHNFYYSPLNRLTISLFSQLKSQFIFGHFQSPFTPQTHTTTHPLDSQIDQQPVRRRLVEIYKFPLDKILMVVLRMSHSNKTCCHRSLVKKENKNYVRWDPHLRLAKQAKLNLGHVHYTASLSVCRTGT